LISLGDDVEAIYKITTLLIESFACRVAAFESAEGFQRFGQLFNTWCLTVDLQVPGMTGEER